MTDASMKSFLPSAYFSGLSVLLCACQSRPPEVVSFLRDCGGESYYVAVNRTPSEQPAVLPMEFKDAAVLYGSLGADGLLPPYGAAILVLR